VTLPRRDNSERETHESSVPRGEAPPEAPTPSPSALVVYEQIPGAAEAATEPGAANGKLPPAHAQAVPHSPERGGPAGALGLGEDGIHEVSVATSERIADAAQLAHPVRQEVGVELVHDFVHGVVRSGEKHLHREGLVTLGHGVGGRDGRSLAEHAGLADGELAAGVDDA